MHSCKEIVNEYIERVGGIDKDEVLSLFGVTEDGDNRSGIKNLWISILGNTRTIRFKELKRANELLNQGHSAEDIAFIIKAEGDLNGDSRRSVNQY